MNDIYEIWDNYVNVIASFDLTSIGKMIAFLKCYPGKYEEEYILEDSSKKQWILKKYLFVTGSVETYEKTKKEECENIFQYLIQPVGLKKSRKSVPGSEFIEKINAVALLIILN